MLFEYVGVRVGGGETAPGADGTRKAEGGRGQEAGVEGGRKGRTQNKQGPKYIVSKLFY
jgi:hypothetical protein